MELRPNEIVVDRNGRVVGFIEYILLNGRTSMVMTIRQVQVPGEGRKCWKIQYYDEEHGGGRSYEGDTLREAVDKAKERRRLLHLFKLRNPTPASAAWTLGMPASSLVILGNRSC